MFFHPMFKFLPCFCSCKKNKPQLCVKNALVNVGNAFESHSGIPSMTKQIMSFCKTIPIRKRCRILAINSIIQYSRVISLQLRSNLHSDLFPATPVPTKVRFTATGLMTWDPSHLSGAMKQRSVASSWLQVNGNLPIFPILQSTTSATGLPKISFLLET